MELPVGRIQPLGTQFISTNLGEAPYFTDGESRALEGSDLKTELLNPVPLNSQARVSPDLVCCPH